MNRILVILLLAANTCSAQWREYKRDIIIPDVKVIFSALTKNNLLPDNKRKRIDSMTVRCSADSSKFVTYIQTKGASLRDSNMRVLEEGGLLTSCERIYRGGVWKLYYSDGTIKSEGEYYSNGYEIWKKGWWKDYYRNGNLKRKYYCDNYPCNTYSDALRCDTINYIEYYESGAVSLTGTYEIGKVMTGAIDTTEVTDPLTQKVSYRYTDSYNLYNVRAGVWRYYNPDGTLRSIKRFD